MSPQLVFTGTVIGIHESAEWSDRKRRVLVALNTGGQVMLPSDRFLLHEELRITVEAVVEDFGSTVLEQIKTEGEAA